MSAVLINTDRSFNYFIDRLVSPDLRGYISSLLVTPVSEVPITEDVLTTR